MVTLCDASTCTGCLSCYQSCPAKCISMKKSKEGFSYPSIEPDGCIECGLCMKVCHQLHRPVLNPKGKVFAAWSKDCNIRQSSSSGGLFTVFARYIIKNNGSVYAAAFNDDLFLQHSRCNDIALLDKYKGSRYIQSDLSGVYTEIESSVRKSIPVLFVGTPCQVAGLYSFLKIRYSCLFTVDLVCHGVPSYDLFDSYLAKLRITKNQLSDFTFRYYNGQGFDCNGIDRNNKKRRIRISRQYYLEAYRRGYAFMNSCYSCYYSRNERVSDITLGDYWGFKPDTQSKKGARKGVSLLLLNSNQGAKLFEDVKDDLEYYQSDYSAAEIENTNLRRSSVRPIERNDFYDYFFSHSERDIIRKYKLQPVLKDYLRIVKRFVLR